MSKNMVNSSSSSHSSVNTSEDEQFFDALSSDDEDIEDNKNDRIDRNEQTSGHTIACNAIETVMTANSVSDNNKMSESLASCSTSLGESAYSSQSSEAQREVMNESLDMVPKNDNDLIVSISDVMPIMSNEEHSSLPPPPQPQPRPPPRVRKKRITSIVSLEENESNNSIGETVNASNTCIVVTEMKEENASVGRDCSDISVNKAIDSTIIPSHTTANTVNLTNSLMASNLTSFLDDIASIKGDLSVNEVILSHIGDRRSVYAEESSKPYQEILSKIEETKPLIVQMPNKPIEPHEQEILNQVMILNIDTGEKVPLSKAEEILPKCLNPLSVHLMKLTNEFVVDNSIVSDMTAHENYIREHTFDDEDDDDKSGTESKKDKLKKGMKNLKKFGTGIMKGVKGVKTAKERSTFHVELKHPIEVEAQPRYKLKVNHKRGTPDFEGLRLLQELYDCKGAIWCLKFSVCGQLLAAAGQDHLLRVYCCQKAWKYFTQLRNKASGQQISPNSTKERDNSSYNRSYYSQRSASLSSADLRLESSNFANFMPQEDNTLSEEGPMLLFSAYRGHTADVLDIAWSKNHFLLSSSMDKTVRLWHITRIECLCTFRHIDFVTTIQFHPRDDRYFLSGSLDGKLRLWNIPDKRVTLWNEVMALPAQQARSNVNQESIPAHGLITSSSFVQNGKFAVIGTYDGRIIFYSTDQLKYFTQIHVSGSGKNVNTPQSSNVGNTSDRRRRRNNNKVTGIEGVDDNKILVTTNDSRLRLYDLRDLSLTCKYRGCLNESSQIKASISHDSKYIICGSENASFYIWRLQDNTTIGQRRDRNKQYECVRLLPPQATHNTLESQQTSLHTAPLTTKIVTSAIFAPIPAQIDDSAKYIIAAADFNGNIRIFCK